MDSSLFNYFVTEVVETMIPLTSWTRTSQKVIGIAIDVRSCHYIEASSNADHMEGSGCHAFSPCGGRMPLSISSEITSAAMRK